MQIPEGEKFTRRRKVEEKGRPHRRPAERPRGTASLLLGEAAPACDRLDSTAALCASSGPHGRRVRWSENRRATDRSVTRQGSGGKLEKNAHGSRGADP